MNQVFEWLCRVQRDGTSEAQRAAKVLKAYYEGAEERTVEIGDVNIRQRYDHIKKEQVAYVEVTLKVSILDEEEGTTIFAVEEAVENYIKEKLK